MKPNPVKKTVEYCNTGAVSCKCYGTVEGYGYCCKHKRQLSKPHPFEEPRPSWCADETFVRVRIRPVINERGEYCICDQKNCHLLEMSWNHDTRYHYCPVIEEHFSGSRTTIERPEACRKLEVE